MYKLPESLTTVTPISKIVALILFILLPFFGFYLGMQYSRLQYVNEYYNQGGVYEQDLTIIPTSIPSALPTVVPTSDQLTLSGTPEEDSSGTLSCTVATDCPVTFGECHPSNPDSCGTVECISGRCVYSNP